MGSFTLTAPPNTDLWRKPPSQNISTAPILYTSLRNPFVYAEVTVCADWEHEWDQGGLVIFTGIPPGRVSGLPSTNTHSSNAPAAQGNAPPPYAPPAPTAKWVKVGLEFCNGACHATSVCATSEGADWSLTALPPHHARRSDLRIKMERIGYALWVWYQDEVLGWKKLREVTWFFWGVEDKNVRVGVYASRPVRHSGPNAGARNLTVDFEGLEIF
jgi:regulation of enolase protein 1 (concanavalin A-like superfamily)